MELTKEHFENHLAEQLNLVQEKMASKEYFENHLAEQLNLIQEKMVSKEHFDSQLQSIQEKMASKEDLSSVKSEFQKQFTEIHNRLDNITTTMATKDELKDSLADQTKSLQDYSDQVAETIIDAIDSKVNKLEKRLVVLETVK